MHSSRPVLVASRRSPPWRVLAEDYRRSGRYRTELFVPKPLPPGFPTDLLARIQLWNETFSLDFFTCRARLSDIAEASWRAVRGAEIVSNPDPRYLAERVRSAPDTLVCFTDDDDWFAPALVEELAKLDAKDICALRWAAPLFNGHWQFRFMPRFHERGFVRAYRRIRHIPVLVSAFQRLIRLIALPKNAQLAGNIFFTNNYALGSGFLANYATFAPATDHCDATDLFLANRLPIQTFPSLPLSVTNKHPCSAGVLGHAIQSTAAKSALRSYVEQYVSNAQTATTPPGLNWAQPYLLGTVRLFSEALG